MEEKKDLITDLYTYLQIDTKSEEVALFNTKNKIIEDIYFTDDSLIIKFQNSTITYLNGATSIKEIDMLKNKTILSHASLESLDDFIIYKYQIKGIDKPLQIRCLKASLTPRIKDEEVLLFYTYSMFFKRVKDITNKDKDTILTIELIDGNIKQYRLLNCKLTSITKYLKGYFKNELKDFNLNYNESYEFSCSIYKDNKNISLVLKFSNIEILK